ncbi:Pentatricopeptide repeat-containing protein [Acorus gramineus]|uniref:Pentatricopeptide repeat-containing protein n=1 Tax=Acorus gramineus TaxID=55184 RepID=A0AAV9BAR3_ACOGR|nr:Pentatricopeptide repeat-containing protein [Acorus gramineus]
MASFTLSPPPPTKPYPPPKNPNNFPSPPSIKTTNPNPTPTFTHADVVRWTSSITRKCRSGLLSQATSDYSLMLSAGVPHSHVTLVVLLSACADSPRSAALLRLGSSLHAHSFKFGLSSPPGVVVGTSLVDMYAKSGRADLARKTFDTMPERNSRSWNAMIDGYMRSGDAESAIEVFDRAPMRDKVSWTALIDGFARNGRFEEALQCFHEMQLEPDVETDYVTVIAAVTACAGVGALTQGLWLHRYSLGSLSCRNADTRVGNSLIDMYARCGRVDLAVQVFDGMRRRSRVSWNSLIVGFAMNGCAEEALRCFDSMREAGFEPGCISFTGALTACAHAGLVDEGLRYYECMKSVYGISPRVEHYGCIVDLLARAGRLEDALGVVESMPMEPNEVVIGSLLSACRVHGYVGLAERSMGQLAELEPGCDANYVLLSNAYAAVGRWDSVGKVRNEMKSLGIRKRPGCSSVEIDCKVHKFVSGDRSHVCSDGIYAMLDLLHLEMELYEFETAI